MRMRHAVWFIIILSGLGFSLYGLYDSPIAQFHHDTDIKVEAEYANGVLTASGILFGIWAIIIGNKPKGSSTQAKVEKWLRTLTCEIFYLCLGFLILAVLFLTLTAVGLFSSVLSLVFSAFSFITNALFLTISVQHYSVAETDEAQKKP